MSKGSKPRPIDMDEYHKNFDKIFGKKPFSSLAKKNRKKILNDLDQVPEVELLDEELVVKRMLETIESVEKSK